MDIELLILHLKHFVATHGFTEDLPGRKAKLIEEVEELIEAIHLGTPHDIIKECADVCLICFHIMLICGCRNPLWAMFNKIQEVSARPHYQQMRRDRLPVERM